MFIAAALTLSARSGIADAGYGLAFSLAPVGVYDVAKWWFRSRATRTAWLTRARAAGWLIAVRWAAVVTAVAGMTWVSVLQWQESSKPAPAPAIIDQPIKHKVPVKPNEAFDPTDPDLNPPRG
jgi:hypothetical protein